MVLPSNPVKGIAGFIQVPIAFRRSSLICSVNIRVTSVLLLQLCPKNIAQIDCFPAYCVERVTARACKECLLWPALI